MSVLNSPAIWASKCLAGKFLFLLDSWLLQKYFGQIKKHFTIACVCVGAGVSSVRVLVWQRTFAASAWWLGKKFSRLRVYPKWPKRLHFVPSWQLQLATCYAQLATRNVAQFIASYCCNNFSTHPFLLSILTFVLFFVLFLLHLLFSLSHFLIAKKLLLLLPHLSAASPSSSIPRGGWGQRLLVIS